MITKVAVSLLLIIITVCADAPPPRNITSWLEASVKLLIVPFNLSTVSTTLSSIIVIVTVWVKAFASPKFKVVEAAV